MRKVELSESDLKFILFLIIYYYGNKIDTGGVEGLKSKLEIEYKLFNPNNSLHDIKKP